MVVAIDPTLFGQSTGGGGIQVADGAVLDFSDKTMFVLDDEHANIARLYSAALDRAPDAHGLAGWEAIYANQVSATAKAAGVYASLAQTPVGPIASIADGFVQSPEFQAKYGAMSDAAFVTQLYTNVLGRAPDTAGLNGWLDEMAHGATRATVIVGFAESTENIAKTAADWLIHV